MAFFLIGFLVAGVPALIYILYLHRHRLDTQGLSATFESLAYRIFESRDQKFKQDSFDLLFPLKERLIEFQKKMDDSFSVQNRESVILKTELLQMLDLNKKLSDQAENLTNALKGQVKIQGNWGEIILEKILEDSGLRKGIDYSVQGIDLGLKNSETGTAVRPDIIVNLPDNKHLIIDSKVSLLNYEQYVSSKEATVQQKHLGAFLGSVRAHIKDLESKQYQLQPRLNSPDFVLLFMPIEGAYLSAIVNDSELHRFAWDRKIVLVGPSTLMATLKTIASIWQIERQSKHVSEIADEGGKLYDKIAGFVEDMERLRTQMKTTQVTFDGAMNKLSEGKGSILSRTEKMRELGAKTSKELPKLKQE